MRQRWIEERTIRPATKALETVVDCSRGGSKRSLVVEKSVERCWTVGPGLIAEVRTTGVER